MYRLVDGKEDETKAYSHQCNGITDNLVGICDSTRIGGGSLTMLGSFSTSGWDISSSTALHWYGYLNEGYSTHIQSYGSGNLGFRLY